MKRIFIIILFAIIGFYAHAQQCHAVVKSDVLIVNEIKIPNITTGNSLTDSNLKNILSYKFLTNNTEAQLKENVQYGQGITKMNYEINYNSNCIVSVTIITTKTGAYEWQTEKSYNFNLNNGNLIVSSNLFTASGKTVLQHKCDSMLQSYLKKMRAENPDSAIKAMTNTMKFKQDNLESFKIIPIGIVFRYNFGFPPIYNMEDYADITVKFNELKKFINPAGPLNFLQ